MQAVSLTCSGRYIRQYLSYQTESNQHRTTPIQGNQNSIQKHWTTKAPIAYQRHPINHSKPLNSQIPKTIHHSIKRTSFTSTTQERRTALLTNNLNAFHKTQNPRPHCRYPTCLFITNPRNASKWRDLPNIKRLPHHRRRNRRHQPAPRPRW